MTVSRSASRSSNIGATAFDVRVQLSGNSAVSVLVRVFSGPLDARSSALTTIPHAPASAFTFQALPPAAVCWSSTRGALFRSGVSFLTRWFENPAASSAFASCSRFVVSVACGA